MQNNLFNTAQQDDLSAKVVIGLERVAEAFKSLLWEQAKTLGVSPIQIRILIFTAYHQETLCNVSYLAKEFNVTKPTISDAVRVLFNKGLIEKEPDPDDSRSYTIRLSVTGKKMVGTTQDFAQPIVHEIAQLPESELLTLYKSLIKLIHNLNRIGILNVQRTCFSCKYYEHENDEHYCHFLKQKIHNRELRLDCPEFMEASLTT